MIQGLGQMKGALMKDVVMENGGEMKTEGCLMKTGGALMKSGGTLMKTGGALMKTGGALIKSGGGTQMKIGGDSEMKRNDDPKMTEGDMMTDATGQINVQRLSVAGTRLALLIFARKEDVRPDVFL